MTTNNPFLLAPLLRGARNRVEAKKGKKMKLYNKSKYNLSHAVKVDEKFTVYRLEQGQIKDIPDDIASQWLKIQGVEKYADPVDLEKLKKENEALKAKVEKQEKKTTEKKTTKITKGTKTAKTKKSAKK